MSLYHTCCTRLFSALNTGLRVMGDRSFGTTPCVSHLIKLSRVRVVDNSALGRQSVLRNKKPKVIHVYNKQEIGTLGDKVLLAICGQKKRAYIVGVRQKQKAMVPRFDTNNVVLVEDSGVPTGTRVRVPIPSMLRAKSGEFSKILALAPKFV